MTAQDAADNIRAKQGVADSIDPNFHADQVQLIADDLAGNYIAKAPLDQLSVAIGGEWVNAAQASGAPIYTYTEVATSSPGLVLLDNTDLSLVTQITITKLAINGADSTVLLEKIARDDVISISDYLDNDNYLVASVTGDAVEAGDTFQIPVSVSDSNGALTAGELTSLSYSPTACRDKAYIILESRVAQAISTDQANPTVLDSWVVLKSNGISLQGDSIRNDTGRVIEVMSGTAGLHPQVDGGGGSKLIELTSERSADGVTYTVNDQLRPIYTSNNQETYNTKESYITDFQINEYVRLIAFADSNISIAPSSTTIRNQLVTGPAMLWIIAEP